MLYLLIPGYLEIQVNKCFCDGVFSLIVCVFYTSAYFFKNLVGLSSTIIGCYFEGVIDRKK